MYWTENIWMAAFALIHGTIVIGSFWLALKKYNGSAGHKILAVFLFTWADLVFTALFLSPFNLLGVLPAYASVSCLLAVLSSWLISAYLKKNKDKEDQLPLSLPNEEVFRFSPLVIITQPMAIRYFIDLPVPFYMQPRATCNILVNFLIFE
jgi:hypothetical protein